MTDTRYCQNTTKPITTQTGNNKPKHCQTCIKLENCAPKEKENLQ